MKFESNIAVKNVLQVYVTTTTIFYAFSSEKVRTPHAVRHECGLHLTGIYSTFNILVNLVVFPTDTELLATNEKNYIIKDEFRTITHNKVNFLGDFVCHIADFFSYST